MINTYIFSDPGNLAVYDYPVADIHCIVGHHRNRYFPDIMQKMEDYDVIPGKIANDNTNITITAYPDGLYGVIGSDSADAICIRLLLPERLKDQYCFRTDKALHALTFEGSERIWL